MAIIKLLGLTLALLVLQGKAQPDYNAWDLDECVTSRTYTAVSGDTCAGIARAHGVPRGSLVFINNIRPDCGDLRVGQVLCLPASCQLYPVYIGSSCLEIAEDNEITVDDLFEWNQFLDIDCTNLLAGDQVCVAEPEALPTATPPVTTITASATKTSAGYATATVEPPGSVPRGTTRNCGEYYQVRRGDYCDTIADRFSIDLQLFEDINPSINDECTNLVPGLYYCVLPTRDWNATTTATITATYTTAPAPTTSGTTDQCYEWYVVRPGDTCDLISASYGISVADIRLWNPSVNLECSNLRSGRAYCVHGEALTIQTSPGQKGRRERSRYQNVTRGDGKSGLPIDFYSGNMVVAFPARDVKTTDKIRHRYEFQGSHAEKVTAQALNYEGKIKSKFGLTMQYVPALPSVEKQLSLALL
ncbi:hypothetical protein BDV06DRAFT_218311 [Aspergillus oleicola]